METLTELSTDIKRHIEALHKTADVGHKVEARMTNLGIDQLQRQVTSQQAYLEKTWDMVNRLNSPERQQEMMTQISVQMFHLLQGKDWLHENVGSNPYLRAGDDMSVCETIEDSRSPLLLPRPESRAISDAGSFSDEGFNPFDPEPAQPCHIDGEVATALHSWLSQRQPTFLWVSGSADAEDSWVARSVAQAFVRSTVQSGTPVLWHSCVLGDEEGNSQHSARTGAFHRLLRSLIQQLTRLSRPTRPPSPWYSPAMLAQQPGSSDDLNRLEMLLQNAPPVLLCSVDDLQLLDDPAEDNEHLLAFVRVLRKYGDSCVRNELGQGSRIFKVLFTTRGQSWVLSSELDAEEICSAAEDWRASLYPGEEAPGRLTLTLEPSISSLSL